MTWSHFEVEELVQRVLKKERAQVDDILAKRLDECFCAQSESAHSYEAQVPCAACLEVARIRGTLQGRSSQLQGGPG